MKVGLRSMFLILLKVRISAGVGLVGACLAHFLPTHQVTVLLMMGLVAQDELKSLTEI